MSNEPDKPSYADHIARAAGMLRYKTPVKYTPEGIQREQTYYEALGRFVQMYAEVEQVAAQTLWKYAGTSRAVSTIVFSGTRTDQGSTWIKQLAVAIGAGEPACDDLENVLQQLSIINGARNSILHFGAENIAEGKAVVSDAWRAKAEPTEFAVSPESLSAMTDDLRKVIAHLAYRHLGRPWPKSDGGKALLNEVLQRPWQYKHPVPKKTRASTQERPQDRKRAARRSRLREAFSK